MPLTKQYLTYRAECSYGVVTGRKGGALLTRGEGRRLVAVSPALEDIKIWEPRTSTVVRLALTPVDVAEVDVIAVAWRTEREWCGSGCGLSLRRWVCLGIWFGGWLSCVVGHGTVGH